MHKEKICMSTLVLINQPKLSRLGSLTPKEVGLTHFFPRLRFRNQVPTFAVRETASLDIMGCSENTIVSEGFRGHPNFPHYAERRSLSDSKC